MKKLALCLVLFFHTIAFGQKDVCNTNYIELGNIVRSMGWTVTSEMGGGHNSHSRHYIGKAIDVRTRDKTEFDIATLYTVITEQGYIFRDERTRPKGQRVYHGAHIHLQIPYCK